MLWPLSVLLLLVFGWFFLKRKHQPHTASETPLARPDTFLAEMVQAIATYEKDQLAYSLRQTVILEGYPGALLAVLEAKYGRCEGVPFLALQGALKPRARDDIRAWMAQNGMPFNEGYPAVQQLEKALEARIAQQARQILEQAEKGPNTISQLKVT